MKLAPRLALLFLLPLALIAAEHTLKVDPSRSFVEVDVDATKNFTAHLDRYEAKLTVDDTGKIKTAVFTFKFADLKTGNESRDADMIKWLGGGSPEGRFELGNLAITPDGQGQVSGRLSFHDAIDRIEFPVNLVKAGGDYTLTGETVIDHRNWNLKIIRKAMVFTVNPEVKVRFKLTATVMADPVKP